MIPKLDTNIKNIENKKMVVYTANRKGQFPYSFNRGFIPSSVPMDSRWYLGYTDVVMEDFNTVEIDPIIGIGLQSFNIINGEFKKYNQYFEMNPDNEKLEIKLTSEDITNQSNAKKFILDLEINFIFDEKLKDLISKYKTESITWDTQLKEAEAFMAGETENILLEALSAQRGIPVQDVATEIIDNNNQYKANLGNILGEKYKLKDDLKKLTLNSDLNVFKEQLKLL